MKIKWQYHDPESSPGTVIIDKRALEGAGSDELAQLAKSQAIGATVGTAVGLTLGGILASQLFPEKVTFPFRALKSDMTVFFPTK